RVSDGLSDFCSGWIKNTDRRANGGFCCCRRRHCRCTWSGWLVHVYGNGRNPACCYGRYRNGDGGEIYPATGRDRVHQRNCGFDCQDTGEVLLRAASGESTGRVMVEDEVHPSHL